VLAQHEQEERRLAYVALTRARHVLLASGYAWDTTRKPRRPSPYLETLREHSAPECWFAPDPEAVNPRTVEPLSASWPVDPFDPTAAQGGVAGRRAAVEAGAELVRVASEVLPGLDVADPAGDSAEARRWREDVELLLAERARLARADRSAVELPRQLSVSQLVELQRSPGELARSLRRPLPRPPAPWARRGTAFHTWLEQRWQQQTLLDLDELPGAADDGADDTDLAALRDAFERSVWADRTPAEVEVPFEMPLGDRVIRGRMDAVFGSPAAGWQIVDWKTGRRSSGAAAAAAAIQLATYRLAWARLQGIDDTDVRTVRAAFHYVRTGETIEPADLLDAAALRALIAGGRIGGVRSVSSLRRLGSRT
jgi:DNA helicase-2/ATP-dependent DNA helicase PcrA